MDVLGAIALVEVTAEWLALGRLSGIGWPGPSFWAARWALYLLVGAFLVGLAQLLLALVGVGFGNIPITLIVALAGALTMRVAARRAYSADADVVIGQRERIGWLILAAILVAAAARSFIVPEAGWDAFSHWGLKARSFAVEGTILDAGTVHEYYPPLVPLLEAWLARHRGAVSIDQMKTIWPLIGSALAIGLGWHLRLSYSLNTQKWLGPYLAAGIVLATTQLLESFWTGQADLALTAYLTLATLAAWQHLQSPHRMWLVQLAVFGAAASLTKYEGVPRIAVVVVALLIEAGLTRCRKPLQPALVLGAAAIAGYAPWLAYRALHDIPGTNEHISQFQPLAIGGVLLATAVVLAGIRTGGAVIVVVVGWIAAGKLLIKPPLRLLTLIVLGHALATLLAFLISETAPDIQARTSVTRLVEQFLPIALFTVALLAGPIIGRGR